MTASRVHDFEDDENDRASHSFNTGAFESTAANYRAVGGALKLQPLP